MSNVTTNPSPAAHRAQIVAEAVVSAYIHEIAAPVRARKPVSAHVRRGATESSQPVAARAMGGRSRRGAFAPRRRSALGVVS